MAEITEQFGQAFTDRVGYTKSRPVNGTQFIDLVRDLLVQSGWTLAGGVLPWMSFWTGFLPADPECDLPPLPVRPCGGYFFYEVHNAVNMGFAGFYNERIEIACEPGLVPMGCTYVGSVSGFVGGLASAAGGQLDVYYIPGYPPNRLESDGPEDLSWPREAAQIPVEAGIYSYVMKSRIPGPADNGVWHARKFASGYVITGDDMYHGGWMLQSAAANGRTTYRLDITEEVRNWIRCRFRMIDVATGDVMGGYVDYWLDLARGETFDLIANPYQFALFCEGAPHRTQGFLASAPYSPDALGVQTCVLITGTDWRSDLVAHQWGQSLFWNQVWSQALNSGLHRMSGGQIGMPCIANLRHGSGPVLTPNGKPVAQTPWVQMSVAPLTEGGIVGQIWDAVVMSDWYPHDSSIYLSGRIYRRVCGLTSYAGRTPCSLWLAIH